MKHSFRLRAKDMRALVALAITGASLFLAGQRADAQAWASFKVLGIDNAMTFSVNNTVITPSNIGNLNSLLNTTAGFTNSIDVGFKVPPSPTEQLLLRYDGAVPGEFGGVTLNNGDILRVFGIGGVFLGNDSGLAATVGNAVDGSKGNDIFRYTVGGGSGGQATDWGFTDSQGGLYTGYKHSNGNGYPDNANWLAYAPFGNYGGKNWMGSEKAQYGTFLFKSLTHGAAATNLGLDVIALIEDKFGNPLGGGVNKTGRVKLTSLDGPPPPPPPPPPAVPEGSSLPLMLGGLLPICAGAALFRRRQTQMTQDE